MQRNRARIGAVRAGLTRPPRLSMRPGDEKRRQGGDAVPQEPRLFRAISHSSRKLTGTADRKEIRHRRDQTSDGCGRRRRHDRNEAHRDECRRFPDPAARWLSAVAG